MGDTAGYYPTNTVGWRYYPSNTIFVGRYTENWCLMGWIRIVSDQLPLVILIGFWHGAYRGVCEWNLDSILNLCAYSTLTRYKVSLWCPPVVSLFKTLIKYNCWVVSNINLDLFHTLGSNHPNWRTLIFQRSGSTTNQNKYIYYTPMNLQTLLLREDTVYLMLKLQDVPVASTMCFPSTHKPSKSGIYIYIYSCMKNMHLTRKAEHIPHIICIYIYTHLCIYIYILCVYIYT